MNIEKILKKIKILGEKEISDVIIGILSGIIFLIITLKSNICDGIFGGIGAFIFFLIILETIERTSWQKLFQYFPIYFQKKKIC
ncbi:MAG: hypothetical protein V1825_03805 [Candidatus Falkowbacteria bacterium]